MILYVGVHPRYFYEFTKTHVCNTLDAKVSICGVKIFGVFGTLVPEDENDPNLCLKCRDKVNWDELEDGTKVWLEMEYLYE